jgi:hypothetical protein
MGAAYHFITEWRVTGTVDEVKAVLNDGLSLPRWWPSVYLTVEEVNPGGPDDVGRTIALYTKGWLPYTLRWNLTLTEPVTDSGFALSASGDLDGTGRWTFIPEDGEVLVTYDWRVQASKPLLRRLSWLLRPAFAANHRWAMTKGERSLQLEMDRRRAPDEDARRKVPAPPPPTFRWLLRRKGVDV